jgi:hypothetical protein
MRGAGWPALVKFTTDALTASSRSRVSWFASAFAGVGSRGGPYRGTRHARPARTASALEMYQRSKATASGLST